MAPWVSRPRSIWKVAFVSCIGTFEASYRKTAKAAISCAYSAQNPKDRSVVLNAHKTPQTLQRRDALSFNPLLREGFKMDVSGLLSPLAGQKVERAKHVGVNIRLETKSHRFSKIFF